MKIRLPATSVAVAVVLLSAALGPVSPSAEELSAKELKKVSKQAGNAFGAGQYAKAIVLYNQILASTSGTDTRRGDALYASALIRLSADTEHQDVEAARRHLDQLAAFPTHPDRLAVGALRDLFTGLDSARDEAERRVAELEAKIAAYQAEQEQAEVELEEAAGESEAVGDRVRSLESRLRKVRAELAECQAELETKEQALQKLRDALVGGS